MKYFNIYLGLLLSSLVITSCSDDSSPVDPGKPNADNSSKYVIAAEATALEEAADYLLTVDSLSGGSVSTVDNGVEQDGTSRYYVINNGQTKFFSFLYGTSGAVTSYQLDSEGELEEIADFQSDRVHAFAPVEDDILSMHIPGISQQNAPTARWYRLNTVSTQFVDEGEINTEELAGNGEWAFFSWIKQVGDHVFAPYFSISAAGNNVFSTQYPDSAWVAVYSYPDMKLQTVIKDDRTSFIGRYYTNGLSVDENGDVYAFSPSVATDDQHAFNSTKPSAVIRINDGELAFDQDYYFNLEDASGGYHTTNQVYASDGNVVIFMADDNASRYAVGKRLAVINLYDKSFTWIDGLPDPAEITDITGLGGNYTSEDGNTVYTGITTEDGSYVYKIDVPTATATQGLHVEGGKITAIHKLNIPE